MTQTTTKDGDVNGPVTPISKETIKQVQATAWTDLPISKLHEELAALRKRYDIFLSMDKQQAANQVLQGIKTLEAIINVKYQQTDGIV